MTKRTLRELSGRMVELGMLPQDKAVAALAHIGNGDEGYLDQPMVAEEFLEWLPEFGVAFSVHGEDVDYVGDYYRFLFENEVSPMTGVTFSDVVLVRDEDHGEVLHFLRDGETVWWVVEHLVDDYVDQGAVADQIEDLEPGGDDPRVFHQYYREEHKGCEDDYYVLATPEQARALTEEFGIAFEDRAPSPRPEAFLDGWRSEMDSALAGWRNRFLPTEFPFDFTLSSLDALEPLVLDRFADWAAVDEAVDSPFVVGAVRYVGEALLRAAPGKWDYRGWDETLFGKHPFLSSATPRALRTLVVPLHTLARLAADREPGTLRAAVDELRAGNLRYERALRLLDEQRDA
ncbi:hypothetical protein [Allokutzneria albata]|uniref:Uncharacterized protein n=1 Tax=Allokutzneria albata TaxID=211114 RepID=A0A1G9RJF9_ALLAB|nr:hypothetical protein [Allokutzneria albata]SDM23027.1 hypothetical protein SAMN04489726_0485 [Allokutzneria albata]